MSQRNIVAVLGGGGRTGKYVVNQLLSEGYNIKVLIRNPESFQYKDPRIEVVKGDATDPLAVRVLISNSVAVVSMIGQRSGQPLLASLATLNILKAMTEFKVTRYILVAGINVDTPFDKKGATTVAATEWMKTNFPEIHEDRQNSYAILSTSEMFWTLVRVPVIEFSDSTDRVIVSLDDCHGSKITAGDIAKFVVGQLKDETLIRKSPFIANN